MLAATVFFFWRGAFLKFLFIYCTGGRSSVGVKIDTISSSISFLLKVPLLGDEQALLALKYKEKMLKYLCYLVQTL